MFFPPYHDCWRRPRRSEAFTIAEVMLAMIVLVFAISTSIVAMQRGFNTLDAARGTTYAAQIMQTEIEKVRLYNWATVSAYPAAATTLPIDGAFTSIPVVGSRYTLTRSVTTVHAGMLQITYTVTWRTYDGRALTASTTTYYGQNGLYDYISS